MTDSVSLSPLGADSVRFGLFEVDLRSGELRRRGTRVKLQEQPFQVLAMLLERPGELVTRDAIQRRLWPDTIVDFESNLNAAIKRLREALGDSASNPRFVETVPRRGYRFIAAPEVRSGTMGATDPSIAVLPFRDRSPDRDQEYYADGLSEELTDALTKVEHLRVVSRISAFRYKDAVGDIRKIGSELDVATLLEGSVRKVGDALRITAHLTRVEDGCHIWSGDYECDVEDVFDIQDEITGAIVQALNDQLGWGLARSRGPRLIFSKPSLTPDTVAHDLYLQGLYLSNRKDRESIVESIDCFRKAIERDAGYALAHAALAEACLNLASMESLPAERAGLENAGRSALARYLRMIEANYERKVSDPSSDDS